MLNGVYIWTVWQQIFERMPGFCHRLLSILKFVESGIFHDKNGPVSLCQNVMSESEMRQKQASRSLAETATKGRATLVAYKNRSLQSVNEEIWPRERRECFGSFEPVFNDLSLSLIVLTQPEIRPLLAADNLHYHRKCRACMACLKPAKPL